LAVCRPERLGKDTIFVVRSNMIGGLPAREAVTIEEKIAA
jgi:hypothetical protein